MATWYVNSATGSTGNGGTAQGDAWPSVAYALGQPLATHDRLFCTGGETITSTLAPFVSDLLIEGFALVPGDGGKYTITLDAGWTAGDRAYDTVANGFYHSKLKHLKFDGNGRAAAAVYGSGSRSFLQLYDLEVTGFAGSSNLVETHHCVADRMYIHDNPSTGWAGNLKFGGRGLRILNNGGNGVTTSDSRGVLFDAIVAGNAGRGIEFQFGILNASRFVVANNGGHGVRYYSPNNKDRFPQLFDGIVWGNANFGLFGSALDETGTGVYRNLFVGGNTQGDVFDGNTNGITTLAANPFTDDANDDFSLNDAADGGAVLKAVTDTFGGTTTHPFAWLAGAGSGGGTPSTPTRRNIPEGWR
ncbi:MAG: hypothetical protein AAGE65_09545 [Planctomycetota bacterium]